MQTSSPISTPKPKALRISFGGSEAITPLKRAKPVNKRLTCILNEEDDERERVERRRSAALQRSISEIPSSANKTITNDSMRGLTEDDLKSQLHMFSKLYCENRINLKNVWSIRVIDVLTQIVSKGEADVFKLAGNSLNIAGKVYGLRVDDLHTDSLKLASSLTRNFACNNEGNHDDDDNVNENGEMTEEAKQKRTKAKKKRLLLPDGKKHTVAANPKEFLGDIPKLESASFSARTDPSLSNTENLFTNRMLMDPAGYKFMLGSDDLAWDWAKGSDPVAEIGNNTKHAISIPSLQNDKLCRTFNNFQSDMWDPDKDEQAKLKLTLDEVVLDVDGIPIPELDGSIPDVFMNGDDADDDDPVIEEVEQEVGHKVQTEVHNIVDFRPTESTMMTTNDRTDYSFNPLVNMGDQVIQQIWAGPGHWKLKYIRNSKLIFSGKKGQDEINKKKTNKRKKTEYEPVDIRAMLEAEDPPRVAKKKSRTHREVEQEKFLLPVPEMIALKMIEKTDSLMIKENVKLLRKRPNEEVDVDYQVAQYDYQNPNDSLYCPGADDNDDGTADHFDDDAASDSRNDVVNMCDNLVDAPEMVDQNYMHYATKAKKVDMKKLKEAVWCTLTQKTEYDLSAKVIPTTFSKMFEELPRHLNDTMKAELSCHLAYVALLHLCNEQTLQLNRFDDITDFGISL